MNERALSLSRQSRSCGNTFAGEDDDSGQGQNGGAEVKAGRGAVGGVADHADDVGAKEAAKVAGGTDQSDGGGKTDT